MTEHHKFCIGQTLLKKQFRSISEFRNKIYWKYFIIFPIKARGIHYYELYFIWPSWYHYNEVEDSWFGRQRKYFVLIWFKRKRNSALWMFGNLSVWTKYRWLSLIFLSAPFLHCIPHPTAITWPAAEAYFSCILCQGHTEYSSEVTITKFIGSGTALHKPYYTVLGVSSGSGFDTFIWPGT